MDKTHPCFLPCWITGASESRLGYVVALGYPKSTVYIPLVGELTVENKKCRFLLSRTEWRWRNYVMQTMAQEKKP